MSKVGKRARGRQRLTYMDGITSVFVGNLRADDLLHAAQDRKRFQNMVANVRV